MLKPVQFTCRETIDSTPHEIVRQILDLTRWPEFHGYGPIPGIKTAEFETQSPKIIGTRIRVTNFDGSTHVEEIVEWQPDQRLQLRMGEFSAPLSRLASGFVESWDFQREDDKTKVTRSFVMHAKSMLTKPVLWFILFFVKQAIARHLREIRIAAKSGPK